MPPIRWADVIRRMLPRYVDAFHLLILHNPPLQLNTSNGSEIALARDLRFLNYPLYTRSVEMPTLDRTDRQPDLEGALSRFDRLCGQIRNAIAISYSSIFLPILAIGFVAFLVSALVFWKRAIWNVCFIMTFVCWALAFERTTLLILH